MLLTSGGHGGQMMDKQEPDEPKRAPTVHMALSKSWDIIEAFSLAPRESSSLPPSVFCSFHSANHSFLGGSPATDGCSSNPAVT